MAKKREQTDSEDTDGGESQDEGNARQGSDDGGQASPSLEEQGKRGVQWLSELSQRMNLEVKASFAVDGDNVVFNISGSDADELVGRSRQSPRVVSAIQTLLSEHLGRSMRGKVVVDIGGFKQKRKEYIASVADQLAKTSRKIGKSITVAGLNSYERRVIHQRLDGADDLDTKSVDHGIFRKLQVFPD